MITDIVNYNSTTSKQSDELFPRFAKLITLEKINLDFLGEEFPNPK